MSAAALLPPSPASDSLRHKRFTREEFDRLLDIGFFDGQRFELIDGELIDKMGQKPPHEYTIRVLTSWLSAIFPARCVLVQLSIEAAQGDRELSLPEPDLAVIAEDNPEHRTRHVRGDEVLLAIEVADTSLRQDLVRKRAMYARAGVGEYWVVDIPGRRVVVHRTPVDEQWSEVFAVTGADRLAPPTQSDQPITVESLF